MRSPSKPDSLIGIAERLVEIATVSVGKAPLIKRVAHFRVQANGVGKGGDRAGVVVL